MDTTLSTAAIYRQSITDVRAVKDGRGTYRIHTWSDLHNASWISDASYPYWQARERVADARVQHAARLLGVQAEWTRQPGESAIAAIRRHRREDGI